MGTIDGAIDRDVPIDVTSSISIGEHMSQDSVPGAVGGVAAVAFPYCLPRSEVLTGKIAPGDTRSVSVDDSLNNLTIILKRSGSLADVRGQQWFDFLSLLISEYSVSLICRHEPTVTVLEWSIKETRPSSPDEG